MDSNLYYSVIEKDLKLEQLVLLKNKTVLITGATGLIGSYFVDALMCANDKFELGLKVCALSRNEKKILKRFEKYLNNDDFSYIVQDICQEINTLNDIDYIFHAASNANPRAYSTEPLNTIVSNFEGMRNVLELAKKCNSKVIYLSSSEAYGKGVENSVCFDEKSGGYIDTTDSRSCYPISKLASECLASCYKKEYGVDFFIIRICHVYGPTMQSSDNRAVSAFLMNVINGENIVLKSSGTSKRCYCYVGDLFEAAMVILNKGNSGEIYNFSSELNLISIRDLAKTIARYSGLEVVFDTDTPQEGGNKNDFIFMKTAKLEELGFSCKYDVESGIKTTLDILMEISSKKNG